MHNKYLDSYLFHISIEKDLAKGSIDNYQKELKAFFKFTEERYGLTSAKSEDMIKISESEDIIKDYLFYMSREKNNKKSTITRKLVILRNFFMYLVKEKKFKEITTSPLFNIELPQKESRMPIYLSVEQCERFLVGIKFFSRYAVRDYAIFQTFLSTGARLDEITKLRIDKVNLKTGAVKVLGKGNKEREVFLTDEAIDAVKLYLNSTKTFIKHGKKEKEDTSKRGRVATVDTNVLFLNKYGRPFSNQGVYALFVSLAKRTGIYQEGLSPHKLRHSYATMMASEVDGFTLKELLGHSSLKTTQIYAHINNERLRQSRTLHPLNRNSMNNEFVDLIKKNKK